jgi:hypothetical protein
VQVSMMNSMDSIVSLCSSCIIVDRFQMGQTPGFSKSALHNKNRRFIFKNFKKDSSLLL